MPEVAESQAEGKVKEIYGDVKDTLRMPFVPPVLRALAVYPDYLVVAWRNLKPNAQTIFFERSADGLREMAVQVLGAMGRPPVPDEATRPLVDVLHYAAPKLLLTSAALRSATNGEQPRMQALSRDEKQQLKPGVPEKAQQIAISNEPGEHLLTESVESDGLLALIPGAANKTALASLETAWGTLKESALRAEYEGLERRLHRSVEDAVTAFPYRMTLQPHILRQCGLSEQDIDAVREILAQATARDFENLANIAYLAVGIEGVQAATESPFPASLL